MSCLSPCSACPNRSRPHLIIPPSGPILSPILLVGERPSWQEVRDHKPFVGDAGAELDRTYLPHAGLSRPSLRVTNAVHCYRDGRNPEDWEVDACVEKHLRREVEQMPYLELVVLMGAHAARTAGVNIEMEHGRPVEHPDYLGLGPRKLFIAYHPALGMRSIDMMWEVVEDFKALGAYLRGELRLPEDEIPEPRYGLIDTPRHPALDLVESLEGPIAMDTETEEDGGMYCFSFSACAGDAWMVEAGAEACIRRMSHIIKGREIWFHNWMFDADVIGGGGLRIDPRQVEDTMLHPFHRQQSQGLKVQAWRRCGMRMREYGEVVKPYQEAEMMDFLEAAAAGMERLAEARGVSLFTAMLAGRADMAMRLPAPLPAAEWYVNKNGKKARRRAAAWWKRVAGIVHRWEKFEGSDLVKGWEGLAEEIKAEAEMIAGERPEVSLRVVPMRERMEYACRDADACLRVGLSYREELKDEAGPGP